MAKRNSPRKITGFGACKLELWGIPVTITEKNYPKAKDYNKPQYQGKVSQYYVVTQKGPPANGLCPAPYVYKTNDLAAASTTAGGLAYADVQPNHPKTDPFVSSDHVYEVSLLKDFFTYMLVTSKNKPSCNDFNSFFLADHHLENIYKYMPGNNYPDMAALDALVNSAKGQLFNPGSWSVPKKKQNKPAVVTSALINYGT